MAPVPPFSPKVDEYFNAPYFLNIVNYFRAYYYFFWTTFKRIIISLSKLHCFMTPVPPFFPKVDDYFNAPCFLNVVNCFRAYYYFLWTTLKRIISLNCTVIWRSIKLVDFFRAHQYFLNVKDYFRACYFS